MTTEFPLTPGEQANAHYESKPLIFVIGARRYRINSTVEITALRPQPAEVIPIDSRRTGRNTDQSGNV